MWLRQRHGNNASKECDDDSRTSSSDKPVSSPGTSSWLLFKSLNERGKRTTLRPPRFNTIWLLRCWKHLMLLTCVVWVILLVFFHSYIWGDEYSTSGGALGRLVDRTLLALYVNQRRRRQAVIIKDMPLPDVTIKLTRKTEQAHVSTYLVEQINRAAVLRSIAPHEAMHDEQPPLDTTLVELQGAEDLTSVARNRFGGDLGSEACSASWICDRCLSAPQLGSYQACRAVCRSCYMGIVSSLPLSGSDQPLTIVTKGRDESQRPTTHNGRVRRIPPIIHQTWTKLPRTLEHPELVRLQNTWRSVSGYTYHFYTPRQRTSFVAGHFPPLIVNTYQALDEQRQMHLFQLLVLYKVGGIYADMNLLLETDLDTLIEADTALVIPRHDDDSQEHCLWNGLVAAEPGHPVLARMIESVLRRHLASSLNPGYALRERWLLHHVNRVPADHETMPLWKVRLADADSAACDWGVAVNLVGLKHSNPLADHVLGKQPMGDNGDLLVLLMSRQDTGATRLTDVDRNVLVGSIDVVGLDWRTIQERSERRGASIRAP